MNKSEAINEIATALAKAQSEIKGAIADSKNPFFKSSYADLASIWEAIRGPLTKNGLSVVQTTDAKDNGVLVESTLMHISGQWISGSLFMPAEKSDPQTFGKLITYARRYSLAGLVGVPQVDDDAEGSMGRSNVQVNDVQKVAPRQNSQPMKLKEDHANDVCDCGNKMMVSQYSKNQLYCPKCKAKRDIAS